MPDSLQPSRSLSEISHLFLSSVRERQTGGATLPRRRPPGQHGPYPAEPLPPLPAEGGPSADLTPEEFASVCGESAPADEPTFASEASGEEGDNFAPARRRTEAETPEVRIPPVSAVIAAHLNGSPFDRAKEYARHLAAGGERVGLIEADGSEFRLICFDASPQDGDDEAGAHASDYIDARAMTAAIDELSWDLDRWLLVLPNPRACEARELLRQADHWVLLSTCDHDGVVACYRTVKGLVDLRVTPRRPELSLAVLDAEDDEAAGKTHRKLAGVCEQFLDWKLADEGAVLGAEGAAEHLVMCCRPTRDKAQLANAPQWQVLADFLARAKAQAARADAIAGDSVGPSAFAPAEAKTARAESPLKLAPASRPAADAPRPAPALPLFRSVTAGGATSVATPVAAAASTPAPRPAADRAANAPKEEGAPMLTPDLGAAEQPRSKNPFAAAKDNDASAYPEVIDLPDATESAILSAVLRRDPSELLECPLRPPMCPDARLAVTRDRRLVLLAVARPGLGDLRTIGQAFRWLTENRSLIAMAMPQLAIDAHQHPHLRLLVDHADLSADLLQPMLQSPTASLQAYRRLRWGAKTGLLLEAA